MRNFDIVISEFYLGLRFITVSVMMKEIGLHLHLFINFVVNS